MKAFWKHYFSLISDAEILNYINFFESLILKHFPTSSPIHPYPTHESFVAVCNCFHKHAPCPSIVLHFTEWSLLKFCLNPATLHKLKSSDFTSSKFATLCYVNWSLQILERNIDLLRNRGHDGLASWKNWKREIVHRSASTRNIKFISLRLHSSLSLKS